MIPDLENTHSQTHTHYSFQRHKPETLGHPLACWLDQYFNLPPPLPGLLWTAETSLPTANFSLEGTAATTTHNMVKRKPHEAGLEEHEPKAKKATMRGKSGMFFPFPVSLAHWIENWWLAVFWGSSGGGGEALTLTTPRIPMNRAPFYTQLACEHYLSTLSLEPTSLHQLSHTLVCSSFALLHPAPLLLSSHTERKSRTSAQTYDPRIIRLTSTSQCQLRVRRNKRRRPSRSQTSCRSTQRLPRSFWQRVVGVPLSLSTGMCIHRFPGILSRNIQEEDHQSRGGWAVHETCMANDRSDQVS